MLQLKVGRSRKWKRRSTWVFPHGRCNPAQTVNDGGSSSPWTQHAASLRNFIRPRRPMGAVRDPEEGRARSGSTGQTRDGPDVIQGEGRASTWLFPRFHQERRMVLNYSPHWNNVEKHQAQNTRFVEYLVKPVITVHQYILNGCDQCSLLWINVLSVSGIGRMLWLHVILVFFVVSKSVVCVNMLLSGFITERRGIMSRRCIYFRHIIFNSCIPCCFLPHWQWWTFTFLK